MPDRHQTPEPHPVLRHLVRYNIALSSALLRCERGVLTALMTLLVLLILLNVATRYSRAFPSTGSTRQRYSPWSG